MLRWQFQPDEAFAAILDSSLSISIEWLSDQLAGTIAKPDIASLFGTRIWELFSCPTTSRRAAEVAAGPSIGKAVCAN
jgi:hypothetical protein